MRPKEHRAPRRRSCRAWAGSALVLGLVAACGPREPPLTSPGTSTASAVGSARSSASRDAAAKWEGFAELATFKSMGPPFVSRGHFAGRWRAEVFASSAAADVYSKLARSSQFPAGAVLAKKHTGPGEPGPVFVMIKHEAGYFPAGGDWEYLVTEPDGAIEDRGPIPTCARCHAEATADWVFGLPSDAARH